MQFIHLKKVDSTNDYARELLTQAQQDSDIFVVSTKEQIKGRGQRGNHWESENGKNLIFSIVCHPTYLVASNQFILSQSIALSIFDVLHEIEEQMTDGSNENGSLFRVKWPNDIYYCDKKISGTLIECDLNGKWISHCIIGSGINVNQKEFTSDAPNPISLYQIYNKEFDLEQLLHRICDRFEYYLEQIRSGEVSEIREKYMNNLYRNDGFYRYKDKAGEFEARIKGIEPTGHIILEMREGSVRRYEFKEVSIVES